eukprot:167895_1
MLFIIISSLCMVFPIIKVNANYCLTPSGYGLGVTDLNNCQGGTKYCATTGECIRTAICPKCEHGDVPEAKYFCTTNGKDECCTTPCAPQEMCEVPIKYESGDLNNDRCILSRAYCKSKDLCISSTDITCPICPDAKPYFCQLYGGGVCCDRLDESCTNYGPMCEPASSWSNGVYHNKCNDNERLCESKDLCISDSIDNKCPMCDVNKPLWCQRFGGGSCCDRLDENCVNYPRTTKEPVECGDNNNSGRRGPIQCTSDSDCCDGFNCKLDKAKCTPIRDAAVVANEVDYGSNTCYTLSGTGLGVPDYNKCGQGTGMNWCETTGKCIRGATCPECKHDFADTIYCKDASGKEECCEGNECPSDDDDICISPETYNSGVGGSNECDSGERFCSSTGECLASNAGNVCPVCPTDNLSWCQLGGGGLCCKYLPDDQKCLWTYTYSSAKGLGSVSKKDKGNGNGSGSGSDTCESATYDYFIADYGKCAQGSGTKYCEATGECSRDIGKTCAKCPSNKPNYCQLKGGGICCMNDCPISPDQ